MTDDRTRILLVREIGNIAHDARMKLLEQIHEVDPEATDREFQKFAMDALAAFQKIFHNATDLEFGRAREMAFAEAQEPQEDDSKLGTGGRRHGR